MRRLQIVWRESRKFGDLGHHDRTKFLGWMPAPCVIFKSWPLQLNVRRSSFPRFGLPPDTEKGFVDATWFTTGPFTHRNLIDLGGLRICSDRSAMTRRARAVTAISASSRFLPYANTPGSSGTSAIHLPSSSLSKMMVNDCSLPSGGRGAVAIFGISDGRGDYLESQRLCQRNCTRSQIQVTAKVLRRKFLKRQRVGHDLFHGLYG